MLHFCNDEEHASGQVAVGKWGTLKLKHCCPSSVSTVGWVRRKGRGGMGTTTSDRSVWKLVQVLTLLSQQRGEGGGFGQWTLSPLSQLSLKAGMGGGGQWEHQCGEAYRSNKIGIFYIYTSLYIKTKYTEFSKCLCSNLIWWSAPYMQLFFIILLWCPPIVAEHSQALHPLRSRPLTAFGSEWSSPDQERQSVMG